MKRNRRVTSAGPVTTTGGVSTVGDSRTITTCDRRNDWLLFDAVYHPWINCKDLRFTYKGDHDVNQPRNLVYRSERPLKISGRLRGNGRNHWSSRLKTICGDSHYVRRNRIWGDLGSGDHNLGLVDRLSYVRKKSKYILIVTVSLSLSFFPEHIEVVKNLTPGLSTKSGQQRVIRSLSQLPLVFYRNSSLGQPKFSGRFAVKF